MKIINKTNILKVIENISANAVVDFEAYFAYKKKNINRVFTHSQIESFNLFDDMMKIYSYTHLEIGKYNNQHLDFKKDFLKEYKKCEEYGLL